ncbi:MAG: glycosyltransferase family 4 protein [Candidatus Paceibacterota bacterium]|jgi:glycosyltransferase involved in cell wall biosynthesis
MKINIFFPIKNSPWGGGNQFLKGLRNEFINLGIYEKDLLKSDVILFNSFQDISQVWKLAKKYPNKTFIHRVDGPISLVRGKNKIIDKIIFYVNSKIASGTIFQSKWCLDRSKKLGFKSDNQEIIIYNAPDNKIFNQEGRKGFNKEAKTRLISVSWSDNWNKGFEYYQYLDNHFDWKKYDMIFIGRSPIEFKNIKELGILDSESIAKELKESDIFISPNKDEPCSNAIIEALSCGLPVVALNSGGNPELIGRGGELFNSKDDFINKIEMVLRNYQKYFSAIPNYLMSQKSNEYVTFIKSVAGGNTNKKRIGYQDTLVFLYLQIIWLLAKIKNKLF